MMEFELDPTLSKEIVIISRPYSPLRSSSKWRTSRVPSSSTEWKIEHEFLYGENFLTIHRPNVEAADSYSFSQLGKRFAIKQNEQLLWSTFTLWQLINPLNLRAISRVVYLSLFENLYQAFLGSPKSEFARDYALNDTNIDFQDRLGITFCEFYDGLFECLDTVTKSGLINEYLRLVKSIYTDMSQASWFTALNLYSKLHLSESPRTGYSGWMIRIFKEHQILNQNLKLPDLIRPMTPAKFVVPKLLNRTLPKKDKLERENEKLIKKIEKITQIASTSKLKSRSKSPLRGHLQVLRTQLTDRSRRDEKKDLHLNRVSPLSVFPKRGAKETTVVEDVIQHRKDMLMDFLNKSRERSETAQHISFN
ncbi:unnamed protein product [Blepharisma stoltei]|uniref:Uncharacterized protein n=1 Tax=Blepharisma stoltei TaxID=1481888 RepID=A0AAU9J436_9CILI|nr:unnamed protein product [Blepharisma stoltei]